MRQRLVIVGIQESNLKLITNQLEMIFGNYIEITGITLKELNYNQIKNTDIVLLTTIEIKTIIMPFLPEHTSLKVAKRAENLLKMKELFMMNEHKNVLVVNDNHSNTVETVNSLTRLLPNLTFSPYIINEKIPEQIELVVTPGEDQLIPTGFKQVIDIGSRIISLETIDELKKEIIPTIEQTFLSQLYFKSMIYINDDQQTMNKNLTIKDENNFRTFGNISTHSQAFKLIIHRARQLSKTNLFIHIEGEKGTGKQMLAEMIHNESGQFSKGTFYSYNCADKDPQIIKADLFGDEAKDGLLYSFPDGTLFLKNIDFLPFTIQLEIASFIQSIHNQFSSNMRLVTSTTQQLNVLLDMNAMKKELYEMLSSCIIEVPELRERKEDILMLIDEFKNHLNKENLAFSTEAIDALLAYFWPSNIRELYNVISYCVCLDTNRIEVSNLPLFFKGQKVNQNTMHSSEKIDVEHIVEQIEKHGFLKESIMLMTLFKEGKLKNQAYGRGKLQALLKEKKYRLTEQQLRLRIEVLNNLGLLIVRKGRAGTTISKKGEFFLDHYKNSDALFAE